MTLHLVTRRLDATLRAALTAARAAEDEVLLIADGVYEHRELAGVGHPALALAADVAARGLEVPRQCSDAEFVELVVAAQRVHSW